MRLKTSAQMLLLAGAVVGVVFSGSTTSAREHETGFRTLTIVDMIGDVDNFHEGDAADIPRRSMFVVIALSRIEEAPDQSAGVDLDQNMTDRPVGFTHAFDLPAGATITGAWLRLRVTAGPIGNPWIFNDMILLDKGVYTHVSCHFFPNLCAVPGWEGYPLIAFKHLLGFEPEFGQVYDLKIDLKHVPIVKACVNCGPGLPLPEAPDDVVDMLPDLADGQLNVIVGDDSMVDFSKLTVKVSVPCDGHECHDRHGDDRDRDRDGGDRDHDRTGINP